MGSCQLCSYFYEEKIKESKHTLTTYEGELTEKKQKQDKIKEIDFSQRISTIGSFNSISQKNSSENTNNYNYILPEDLSKRENILNFYTISPTILGRGGSSNIFFSKKNEKSFAIKQVLKGGVAKPEEILREAKISLFLNHENIIKYYEIFEDIKFVYFVMELMDSGDLFEFITYSEEGCLSSDLAIDILIQILQAVEYLHSVKNIIHRDIKPENFVLQFDENNNIKIKLIDFGLAIEKPLNGSKLNEIIGTRKYQSPEMICGLGYGEKIDEWAIGVVMFSMLTGYEPFRRTGEYKLEESILYGQINFEIIQDDELRILNERFLDRNEKSRITCKEALNYLNNLKVAREPFYNEEVIMQRNYYIENYKIMIYGKFNLYERNTL